MKTLIVEDEAGSRRMLEKFLGARGHEVCVCTDAETAWHAYQHEVYPLVLLDLQLPGMDGLQLCRQMRALPQGDRSVIVVITGRDQPEDLQAVLEAGADDYLTKPVHFPLLNVRLTIAKRQVEVRTARQQAEEKIQQALTELHNTQDMLIQSEKLAAVGRLTAGVAHEILNPVHIISMRLQLLEIGGQTGSDEVKNGVSICRDQVERIVKIIQNLRSFAHLHAKQAAMSALHTVIEQALGWCAPELRVEGIQTDVHYSGDLPMVLVETERFQQVIVNVITNAIDAMREQEQKVLGVAIARSPACDAVRIVISDTGTGIKDIELYKIFDPFFTTKAAEKSTGLGLSTCYGIVQDHGGTIWAENNASGGASLFVELPVKQGVEAWKES